MMGDHVSVGLWWNDSDRGKRRYYEKTPSHCHFLYQNSHMDWPGIESYYHF